MRRDGWAERREGEEDRNGGYNAKIFIHNSITVPVIFVTS